MSDSSKRVIDCEPFAASCVRPGWICCQCRHYNQWEERDCWKCDHTLCLVAPTPIQRIRTAADVMKDSYGFSVVAKNNRARSKSYNDWLIYLGIATPQITSNGFKYLKRGRVTPKLK